MCFTDDAREHIVHRIKRQQQAEDKDKDKKEENFELELCKDKDAGEWFRLVGGEGDNCRDVIQCTSSVSTYSILILTYCTHYVTHSATQYISIYWTSTIIHHKIYN